MKETPAFSASFSPPFSTASVPPLLAAMSVFSGTLMMSTCLKTTLTRSLPAPLAHVYVGVGPGGLGVEPAFDVFPVVDGGPQVFHSS